MRWGILGAVLLTMPTYAQDRRDDDKLAPSIDGVNLHEITIMVQKRTGYKFLWTEEVGLRNKKVYFKSDKAIEGKENIFRVYQSFLQVNDLMLVPVRGTSEGDKVYKIQLASTLSKRAVEFERNKVTPEDKVVTRVFSLKYVSPRDVHAALINMATYPQGMLAIESAQILLVTDYDYNIRRFEGIIEQMDTAKPDIIMKRIELKYALASEVETMMNSLASVILARSTGRVPVQPNLAGQSGDQVKIVADRRTNSVIVLADPNRIDQIEKAIRELDSETGFETSGIYIVHLKHTNAMDIARTLNAMYKISVDDRGIPSGSGGVRPGQPTGPTGTQPSAPSTTGGTGQGTEPTIVADVRSNSIIIITDRNTYKSIEQIVRKLDSRRPQVLIKATVVEVRTSNNFDLGVELARLVDPDDRVTGVGRSNFGYSTLVPDTTTNEFKLTPIDTTGITLALLHDKIGNIGALIKAVEGKAKISILDEPEAATIDNGTAEMKVSNQVPKLKTVITGTGLAETTFDGFETAETTLSISPHISEGGYLRLDATVKIEKFARESTDPKIPPPKISREIKTNSILVPNSRTVVIGGIVTQDISDTTTGVPLLMDIPILGVFFRRNTQTLEQRTLYIFITPYILYDESFGDFRELTKERKDDIERYRGEMLRRLQVEPTRELTPHSTFRWSRRED